MLENMLSSEYAMNTTHSLLKGISEKISYILAAMNENL